jgi:uroporphyrinogen decarboxylase
MNHRERLLACLAGEIPDCVPVDPDFSNMIPCRLTGKPFWDIYLYNDPPLWKAYVDCAKRFDIDSLLSAYYVELFPPRPGSHPEWQQFIVFRSDERIVTQWSHTDDGRRAWRDTVDVFYVADPPTHAVDPAKIGLPPVPERFEPVEGGNPPATGPEALAAIKEAMGDQGLVGVTCAGTVALSKPEDIYRYYDNPDKHEEWAERRLTAAESRFRRIMAMDVRPDFLSVGGSGTLVYQNVEIFRKIAFPAVRRTIELAAEAGMPTHVHSCGPEKELVRIMAEETDLTVIDPLEVPPMGDCDLAELKRLYGDRIVLKGNLHTTEVMLKGSAEDVVASSKKAIDDAGAGGRFILSTGDQCGRDTPDENLHAMVETARTYGRY